MLLVAEDSDTNFRLIEAVLSRRFSLVRAHTGAEAVDMFGTVQPDAVLMDIRMPVMDGLEATRRIRSVSADVPIIAMSAYSSGSEIESARNAGCNEFLVKPLSQYSLHRALNAALVEFKGKGNHNRVAPGNGTSRKPCAAGRSVLSCGGSTGTGARSGS